MPTIGRRPNVVRTSPSAASPAGARVRERAPAARADVASNAPRLSKAEVASLVSAHLEALRAASAPLPAGAVPLLEGVTFGARGFEVDGRPTERSGGVTRGTARALHRVATKLCALDANPFARLTADQRAAATDHLVPFLLKDSRAKERPTSVSVRSRAASFALLLRLVEGMSTRKEGRARRAVLDLLLEGARSEKEPGLRRQMLLGLDGLDKSLLDGTQARLRKELVSALRPSSPPYDEWFGDDPTPELNVVQSVQDEFWKAELSSYRKAGFEVTPVSEHRVVATKTIEDPSGERPPVKVEVTLLQRDSDVLDAMRDPDVHLVLYTGHSQLGGVGKLSSANGPAPSDGTKLVGFFACRTKQNVAAIQRRYPDAHLLVSEQGTYGHDDRIVIQRLLHGIAARQSYAAIERAAEREELWEPGNYLLPGEAKQLLHSDLDGDGVMSVSGGRRDLVYDAPVRMGPGSSISFSPVRAPKDPASLDGGAVADAVQWFNTEYFYYTEDFGSAKEKARADRFVADGWFAGTDASEIVRVEEVDNPGERPVWRVKVNSQYAHQSPDALAMMVTFALAEKTFKDTRPDDGAYDLRMRALALVSSYVSYHVEYSDVADHLLRRFADRFGFPPSLSWPVVDKAVSSDHHHEASEKVIRSLERGMQYPFLEVNPARTSPKFRAYVEKALDKLRHSDTEIGRATFELIVTGRVKVDCLEDLSRADFQHLRKEFTKDGDRSLEGVDWQTLDENHRAMRAITTSINGYMWDDRVYVAEGMSTEMLARTLVHEVNHVLNASEEHYRGPEAAFLEEYRAYCSEALLEGKELTPSVCRELKEAVKRDYGFDVDLEAIPDIPPGRFFASGPVEG